MGEKTSVRKRLWTYDELVAALPETNQPTELWDGELIMAPSPSPFHQTVVARLARAFSDFVAQGQGGQVYFAPLDVVFTPRRVVQPDIIYISEARQAIIQDRIRGVPDLLVEVVSPGSWRQDYIDKKTLYEQCGVTEYWIVDPEAQMITLYTLEQGTYHLRGRWTPGEMVRSQVLAGFTMAVAVVLAE